MLRLVGTAAGLQTLGVKFRGGECSKVVSVTVTCESSQLEKNAQFEGWSTCTNPAGKTSEGN